MTKSQDTNTETKIKTAARVVFHKKGFARLPEQEILQKKQT